MLRACLLGVGLALYGPWLRSGYLLGYDWSSGPHIAIPPSLFGFGQGRAATAPDVEIIRILSHVTFGIDPVAIALALSPLVLGIGFKSVLGDQPTAWFAAALLMSVNPFVDERLGAGSFGVVLALDLLPFLVAAARDASSGHLQPCLRLALLTVVGTALAPQFVLVGAVLAILIVAARRVQAAGEAPIRQAAKGWIVGLVVLVLCSAYWVVPTLSQGFPAYQRIGNEDLRAFASQPDRHLGLLGNLIGLYGFWRPVVASTKDVTGGWWVFLIAILIVIGYGVLTSYRQHDRRMSAAIAVAGIFGLALSAGTRGPTGGLFKLLYDHLPGFRSFREPEKGLWLLVLAYAVFFGSGVRSLTYQLANRLARIMFAGVLLALPVVYGFAQFWGLNDSVAPARYPVSWGQANQLMSTAPGTILFLPWHGYQVFPFAQNRVVADPAPSYFSNDVLVSSDAEMPALGDDSTDPREYWVRHIEQVGPTSDQAGKMLTPLGVRWIVVYHTTTWREDNWLFHQADIKLVRQWKDLDLFENSDWAGMVYATTASGSVVPLATGSQADTQLRLHASMPIGAFVTLTTPFNPDWRIGSIRPERNQAGTNTFGPMPAGAVAPAIARFEPARILNLATAASALTFLSAGLLTSETLRRRVPVAKTRTRLQRRSESEAFSDAAQ